MIVKQILAMKSGPDEIVTIRPDTTVAEAARLLSERRIGWMLLKPGSPLAQAMETAPGWRRFYRDRWAVVYLPAP